MQNREKLNEIGRKILENTRMELCLSMPFLTSPLNMLSARMDLTTRSIGTDGGEIRFHPFYVMNTFLEHPLRLHRAMLHMLMHCLFRHIASSPRYEKREMWDISCDIAAEAVTDSLHSELLSDVLSDFRVEWYEKLNQSCGVLTAEHIYAYFEKNRPDLDALEALRGEFSLCDHSFWDRNPEKNRRKPPDVMMPPRPTPEQWEKQAKSLRTELETFGKKAGKGGGDLARLLNFEYRERPLYRDFLERFTVLREIPEVDPDSFDYGFYHYGMERYGNMPLIEENEYREEKRVEELVIAIDTSASCQASLVQKFLNETASVLGERKKYFRRVNIRILECDDRIRGDTRITSIDALFSMAGKFTVHGGGGTDFRPVFRYVEALRQRGELKNLRGLLYFTDGFGVYPEKPARYETAFIFRRDETYADRDVPAWALRLYL